MADPVHIDEDSIPKFPRGVRFRFDAARDRHIVLAPERVFMPDDIAVEILKRCDGRAVAAIIDDLVETFNAPRDVIGKDVMAMLQDLADKGVLVA